MKVSAELEWFLGWSRGGGAWSFSCDSPLVTRKVSIFFIEKTRLYSILFGAMYNIARWERDGCTRLK